MASEKIIRELYNGLYLLEHNPTARGRAPRYLVNSEIRPKGVTTILGQTLSKDLMAWAVSCAMECLEAKLPVITKEDLADAAKEYERRRDAGAGTGSEAHALVENFLKGEPVDLSNTSKEASKAYNAFIGWFEEFKPEVINVEEVVYSPQYQYAGTYDCMLRINNKVYLCDLKTTNASRKAPNGVYAEYFLQLGAYAGAHEEQRQYELKNGGSKLEKIDGLLVISAKKTGKLDLVTNEDLGLSVAGCCADFKKVVEIHNFLANTTKLLGGK